ncbi:MAG TPA: DUF2269 family protein [Terrimesophilobacter sp.]|nr:DUF2269 family protein [Terrimesophilobacter sp.]
MSTIFAILHVATAVFIVGPMAILPMTAMRSLRAGQAGQVRTLAKSTTVFTLLSLIPFLVGFGLMGMYKIPFDRTWVWLSIVLYLVAFVIALVLVVPAMRRAAALLEGSESTAPSGYGMIAGGSGVVSLLLLAVVVLMAWKP